jgi:hypothetical protein
MEYVAGGHRDTHGSPPNGSNQSRKIAVLDDFTIGLEQPPWIT